MALAASKRQTVAVRRTGYVWAVLVNAALLYGANVWPGWDVLPFLTGETDVVIGVVNASLIVSLVANLVYLVRDPRWLKALGDILTISVGLVAMWRIWQVFPFDFAGSSFDWTLVARILLVVGIIGSAIGIVAAIIAFVRGVTTRAS